MYTLKYVFIGCLLVNSIPAVRGQQYYPDDPIKRDPDNLSIPRPKPVELSPFFDAVENSFGSQADGPLVRSINVNTLGEVPDSSWFTNRIGLTEMSIDEVVRGARTVDGPDLEKELNITGARLDALTEGLEVVDSNGHRFYAVFDRNGYPRLATGASVISSKFFHAFGYNVFGASIGYLDPTKLRLVPGAEVYRLGGERRPIDLEFMNLFLEDMHKEVDGRFRAVFYQLPEGQALGEFKFYGTRSDDPNDLYSHENRRELRGLRVFAAWLNHNNCRSINTRDYYVTEDGNSYLKHYLVDFSTTLGSGYDLDDRIIPKDKNSGHEYFLLGDPGSTIKTALSLGLWSRPWMGIDYPYPQFAEIGRIEAEHFDPVSWKPDYPNPAFDRMLPDDAFWAARIVSRFSNEAIKAIVRTAEYSDPESERYLVETLIKRRDKIVRYYLSLISPLASFYVENQKLTFRNLGEEVGLGDRSRYEYQWFQLDNGSGLLKATSDVGSTSDLVIAVPRSEAEFLSVLIKTYSGELEGWENRVQVTLGPQDLSRIVGIERELDLAGFD